MQPSLDWRSVKDGADGALRVALALLVLVVATVIFAGPGSQMAVTKMAEDEAAELAALQAPPVPTPATGATQAGDPGVAPAAAARSRDVTPPSITAPATSGTATELTRVAPREPFAPPEPDVDEEAADEARLRLLPRPIAIDTATFLINRGRVRLAGVQPVAPSRECGEGGATWPCGMQARTALRLWLRARSIRCDVPEAFGREDETVDTECSLGPEDIGQWLVQNGWAEAREEGRYTTVEAEARQAGRGIWGDGRGAPPPDTQ